MSRSFRFILLVTTVAAQLSSCTCWHISDRLRDPYVTYTGVDIYHPVDGKVHYDPKKVKDGVIQEAYVVANEITYNKRSRITNTDDFYPGVPFADNFKPTGRQYVVKINRYGFESRHGKLPAGLACMPAPIKDNKQATDGVFVRWRPESHPYFYSFQWGGGGTTLNEEEITQDRRDSYSLGCLAEPRLKQPGWGRRQAINICNYVVDPVLNVIGFPIEAACAIVFVPLGELYNLASSCFEQIEEAPEPDP